MSAVGFPHFTLSRIGAADDGEEAFGGGEAGPHRVQNLGIGIGAAFIGKIKGRLVGDDSNKRGPRKRRKLAARTSISIPVVSESVSAVRLAISCRMIGVASNAAVA